jgi:hypothetical protein
LIRFASSRRAAAATAVSGVVVTAGAVISSAAAAPSATTCLCSTLGADLDALQLRLIRSAAVDVAADQVLQRIVSVEAVSNRAASLAARQASLHASDRPVAPPQGPLTLRFDAERFPSTPTVCYWAPWRLPGPDFHRQATTSFRSRHGCWTTNS